MPAPWRQPHPILARETAVEETVIDAGRRGWPIQLRGVDTERVAPLIASYRETLASAGYSESTVNGSLSWLVVVAEVPRTLDRDHLAAVRDVAERCGASELRLDPAPDVSLDELAAALELTPARSA
jgi:hypothetical protein